MTYKVVLLDKNLNPITQVQAFVPLNKQGYFLEYDSKLSNIGTCRFRVMTKDQLFSEFGDVLQPYINHIRVYRNGALVWSGVIIDNPKRTHNYIEVVGYTYAFYMKKILINHDAPDGSGGENYRVLRSGTLATAVQTFFNEAKARNPVLTNGWKLGTIENPNFPTDTGGNALYTDTSGGALTGAYSFNDKFFIKFDYRDMLYVLGMLGVYSNCDFELTSDLTLNFKSYLGTRRHDMVFEYGVVGGIEDYNVPLSGTNMANRLTGIAADNNFNVFSTKQEDTASVNTYGVIEGVAAFKDAKNVGVLNTRLTEELRNISDPLNEIHAVLNNSAYPLGQYGLGDTVTFKIKDHIINVNELRRIVGIHVQVHNVGRETIRLITNPPRPGQ